MQPRIIYFLGTSFSGSTFLSAALSLHLQMENAGQLHRMIAHWQNPDPRICSCGKTLSNCSFWTSVWQNWEAKVGRDALPEYKNLILHYERLHSAPRMFYKAIRSSESFDIYSQRTRAMIGAIAFVSGRDTIVDASKYPGRGLALSKVEGLDVYYIHLVRNGMAYMSSVLKRRKNSRYANRGTFGLVLQSSLEWVLINLASEFVLKTSGRPGIRLRYEDFLAQPEGTMQVISKMIGLDLNDIGRDIANGKSVSFRHATGNRVRLKGSVSLRADTQWRDRLPSYVPWVFRMTAGWMALRYGYHVSEK